MGEKRIILLGATGSIGENTVEAVRNLGEGYRIVGISCRTNIDRMLAVAEALDVPYRAATGISEPRQEVTWCGPDAVRHLIEETEADIVVNGIAGSPGLMPSVWSLQTGKDLALANKETIVMAGPLVRELAYQTGTRILPVDSEHSALFHLLAGRSPEQVERIIITASGGAFRTTPLERFPSLTVRDALQHPTWDMGAKITVDSATMANKGLEVIEAHHLFDFPPDAIEVLIHPQSCIHSLVRTLEGSYYAQISAPDMRIPIQNALTYPATAASPFGRLDFSSTELSFQSPDYRRYPMLDLAYRAVRKGGSYPLAYNAANEIAVHAFMKEAISFPRIAEVVEEMLEQDWGRIPGDFESILQLHREAEEKSRRLLGVHQPSTEERKQQ
jgi:1-deoxy-D-xylulose-5-phosphate reductoisomerase